MAEEMQEKNNDNATPPGVDALVSQYLVFPAVARLFPRLSPKIKMAISALMTCAVIASGAWLLDAAYNLLSEFIQHEELRYAMPRADPHRLSILIARLSGDQDDRVARRVGDALAAQMNDKVQILYAGTPIEVPSSGSRDEVARQAIRNGQDILELSKADLLLWGDADESSHFIDLHFLPRNPQAMTLPLRTYQLNSTLHLEQKFNTEIGIAITVLSISFLTQDSGRYDPGSSSDLLPTIERLAPLAESPPASWTTATKACLRCLYASACMALAQETGNTSLINIAVRMYRAALDSLPKNTDPIRAAGLQMNLGQALQRLAAQRDSDDLFDESRSAFRAALVGFSLAKDSASAARAQSALADADAGIALRRSDLADLDKTLPVFQAALAVLRHNKDPSEWIDQQNDFAETLIQDGYARAKDEPIRKGIGLLLDSLRNLKGSDSREIARVQEDIGEGYLSLSAMLEIPDFAKTASVYLEAALSERKIDGNNLWLAATEEELSRAFASRQGPSVEEDNKRAYALAADALKIYESRSLKKAMALAYRDMASARLHSAEITADRQEFAQAIQLLESANAQIEETKAPTIWAEITVEHAITLLGLAEITTEKTTRLGYLDRALHELGVVLSIFSLDTAPRQWAVAQFEHACILSERSGIAGDAQGLQQATVEFDKLWPIRTFDDQPIGWAENAAAKSVALISIAQLKHDPPLIDTALAGLRRALQIFEDLHREGLANATRQNIEYAQAVQANMIQTSPLQSLLTKEPEDAIGAYQRD
jgi:hypothetical protein